MKVGQSYVTDWRVKRKHCQENLAKNDIKLLMMRPS